MWKPDRSGGKPLYRQIAEHMEQRISYGELPPGTYLPSERALAEKLGVNRSTVVQAYDELRASGIIESRSGSGTRVSQHIWGLTPKHTPNWHRYVEGGTFLPNLFMLRRIREEIGKSDLLINFASGELAPGMSPNEAISQLWSQHPFQEPLGYGDPQGFAPLREALVSFLLRHRNIRATDSSILITSGSQQSLYLITQCLLSPGDAVAIESPSYCYSLPMFQSAGLRLFGLPVDEHGIRPEDIMDLYRQHRIRMIFLNPNYQNPTGTVLDPSRRIEVLRLCERLGIPIVEDDPFSLTSFEDAPPPPLKSLDDSGTVLYIGSMSKIAASGLRIGWMIAPQSVVNRLVDARLQMDFGLSVLPQYIASLFLESGHVEPHFRKLRRELAHKRDLLVEALRRELPDEVAYSPPQGGLHLWCKVNRAVDDGKLLEIAIKKGVVYVPGSVYGSDSGYIRLAFARPRREDIGPGVAALAEALRSIRA